MGHQEMYGPTLHVFGLGGRFYRPGRNVAATFVGMRQPGPVFTDNLWVALRKDRHGKNAEGQNKKDQSTGGEHHINT
jgi:hypothetical protein